MKKTLLALLALASVAAAAEEKDITLSTGSTGEATLGGFGAFDFSVGSGSKFTATGVDYTQYNASVLKSVTLSVYSSWYTKNNSQTGFAAGIFEKKTSESGTTTWSLVGKTNWWNNESCNSYAGSIKLDVKGSCTLSLGTTYTIAFIPSTGYFESLEIGDTRDTMLGANEWSTSVPSGKTDTTLAAVGIKGIDGIDGSGITMYGMGSNTHTKYTPNASFSVTLCNVPEPGVATLSFLALAGGLLRRRRRG